MDEYRYIFVLNLQNTLFRSQQMLDAEYNIIAVAEARGLESFRMMESSQPINNDIGLIFFD